MRLRKRQERDKIRKRNSQEGKQYGNRHHGNRCTRDEPISGQSPDRQQVKKSQKRHISHSDCTRLSGRNGSSGYDKKDLPESFQSNQGRINHESGYYGTCTPGIIKMDREKERITMMKRKRWRNLAFLLLVCLALSGCTKDEKKTEETSTAKEQTVPEAVTTGGVLTETGEVDDVTLDGMSREILSNMTINEKVGQMIFAGLDSLKGKEAQGKAEKLTGGMENELKSLKPGGIILYSKNMKDQKQVKKLIGQLEEASSIPLFIGVDEEGGEASRAASVKKMQIDPAKSAQEIGETNSREEAVKAGTQIGTYLAELGFNLDFAPVVDVKKEKEDKLLANRSFGTDPELVGNLAAGFVTGIQQEDVSAVLKYFPGQGSLEADTHKGAADIEKTIKELRQTELKPFTAGIEAGADVVMAGHASCSLITGNQTPSSMSELMVTEILRKELRFESVIITDSMNMKAILDMYAVEDAAVKAVKAGVDMLLCPDNGQEVYNGILQAVNDGKIKEKQIDTSVLRILKLKIKRGIIPQNTDLIEQSK